MAAKHRQIIPRQTIPRQTIPHPAVKCSEYVYEDKPSSSDSDYFSYSAQDLHYKITGIGPDNKVLDFYKKK
jgi:hypothetical protein